MARNKPLYDIAAGRLRDRFGDAPLTAVVLGSGLGAVAECLARVESASYASVGLPVPGVAGHSGQVLVGYLGTARVAVLAGRVHMYEGRPAEEVARSVRALARWGTERLILTSAVGGVSPELCPGMIVRLVDHINLMGFNPLKGPNDDVLGTRFPDLAHAYDPDLGATADRVAEARSIPLAKGIYAAMPGPSYETPAEIRMLGLLGAHVVGMSMVPDVITAVHAGLRVLAFGVVANPGAGLAAEPLTHDDVTRVMGEAAARLASLLQAVVEEW